VIRVQSVVLPLLRAALPGVSVVSVIPDVDHRQLPMVHVERVGGTRTAGLPGKHGKPVVRMTAASGQGLVECEELYEDALDALYAAVRAQQPVPGVGHLQSLTEVSGASQIPSGMPDVWTVGGTVELAVRSEA